MLKKNVVEFIWRFKTDQLILGTDHSPPAFCEPELRCALYAEHLSFDDSNLFHG